MKIRFPWLLIGLLLYIMTHVSVSCASHDSQKKYSFIDAFGKTVKIAIPVERIVVINGDAAEILCALGAGNSIVGITSHLAENTGLLSELQGKTVVGSSTDPNLEKIIELRPDLVIAYEMWMTHEAFEAKLAPMGIPVARLYCYRLDRMDEEVRILGKLVSKENQAEAYLQDMHQILNKVETKLKGLHQKIKAYIESYTPYKTFNNHSGWEKMADLAGVINVAADLPVPWPEISTEWLVEKNPDLIVKTASPTYIKTGYGVKDFEEIDAFRVNLMNRQAWNLIQAVKKDRVYILSAEIWTGPRAPLGILYIAKWAYSQRFMNIDPDIFHRQWLNKWHGKALEGIYVYP